MVSYLFSIFRPRRSRHADPEMSDFASTIWFKLAALTSLLSAPATGGQPQVPASARRPVLLIHGIHDSAVSMRPLGQYLEKQGWQAHTLSLTPKNGQTGLPALARQVSDYVDKTFPNGQKIDLVGFSMGGIVCRYYLQRLKGTEHVDRFVSISAPNHGSWVAYLGQTEGCVQMRPGSEFLKELNTDTTALGEVQMTCLWTPLDLMILPSSSSRMPIGKEMRRWSLAHPLMILQPSRLKDVASALKEG
jgi:triacylglycerol lipase